MIRLLRAGVQRKDGNFATGVLHLWHQEADRAALPENERRLNAIEVSDRVRAIAGMSQLSLVEIRSANATDYASGSQDELIRHHPEVLGA